MKNLLFGGLFFSLVLCTSNMFSAVFTNGRSIDIKIQDTITLQGRWELMPVWHQIRQTAKIPFLNFDLKAGKISGNTGCNNINRNFLLKQDVFQFSEKMISRKIGLYGL